MFPVSINARSAVDGRGKARAVNSRFGFQCVDDENSSILAALLYEENEVEKRGKNRRDNDGG